MVQAGCAGLLGTLAVCNLPAHCVGSEAGDVTSTLQAFVVISACFSSLAEAALIILSAALCGLCASHWQSLGLAIRLAEPSET